MNINTAPQKLSTSRRPAPQKGEASASQPQQDKVTLGSDKAGWIGMGVVTGAVGVGAPAAAVMGGLKLAFNDHPILGTGLALAGAGAAALTVPISLMGAAMSTDSGETSGYNAYLASAAVTTIGAGVAIFS